MKTFKHILTVALNVAIVMIISSTMVLTLNIAGKSVIEMVTIH